jgi:serine/threonine protein kinase
VNHPFVCRLYEVLNTPSHILLVSELATEGELFGYIVRHGRLREPVAARLFAQLLEAVDYLHDEGVCHRDLKVRQWGTMRLAVSWDGCSLKTSSWRIRPLLMGESPLK